MKAAGPYLARRDVSVTLSSTKFLKFCAVSFPLVSKQELVIIFRELGIRISKIKGMEIYVLVPKATFSLMLFFV